MKPTEKLFRGQTPFTDVEWHCWFLPLVGKYNLKSLTLLTDMYSNVCTYNLCLSQSMTGFDPLQSHQVAADNSFVSSRGDNDANKSQVNIF